MKSIQLYIEENIRPQVELSMNSGVYPATNEQAPAGAYYRKGAFLPKADWVKIGYDEKERYDSETCDYFNTVGVYSLPAVIVELVHELGIDEIQRTDVLLNTLKEKADLANRLSDELFEVLKKHSVRDTEIYKVATMLPGLYTTGSRKDKEGYVQFIGMHLDSSLGMELTNAERSKNRLCVNLTNEPRYLIFIDISVQEMVSMIAQKQAFTEGVTQFTLADLFFQCYPDFPVLRVRQPAFSYYIAPTDNCVHDGSTLDRTKTDITLTYLGYLKP